MGIKLLPRRIIGQTIRGIRTRLGMSPAEFAKSLGVEDADEVEKWERGTAQPDYGTLAKIAAMGMVDALVFHEQEPDGPQPQLTPGEATALNEILARMEALLAEARNLVNRATSRTAVELLEAATVNPPAQSVESSSLLLDAEVRLESTPRTRSRTASAGRRASSTQPRARTPRNSGSNEGSSTSSSSKSSGSTSRSGGSRSSSSRSGSGGSGSKSSSSGGNASSGGSSGDSSGGTTGASS
jgi:transcriptional regulator with XRE-family HTH domain